MPDLFSRRTSNAFKPAACMRFAFASASTRLMFTALQVLLALRGEKRML